MPEPLAADEAPWSHPRRSTARCRRPLDTHLTLTPLELRLISTGRRDEAELLRAAGHGRLDGHRARLGHEGDVQAVLLEDGRCSARRTATRRRSRGRSRASTFRDACLPRSRPPLAPPRPRCRSRAPAVAEDELDELLPRGGGHRRRREQHADRVACALMCVSSLACSIALASRSRVPIVKRSLLAR